MHLLIYVQSFIQRTAKKLQLSIEVLKLIFNYYKVFSTKSNVHEMLGSREFGSIF